MIWPTSGSRPRPSKVAVLRAANTSLGVALLAELVERAAAALGPEWDIEIAETHHRKKVDAPSGTALMLGEVARSVAAEPRAGRHMPRFAAARSPATMT